MAVKRTSCEAGALVRQHVRKILNDARSHGYEDGIDVRWDEAKGWLESAFTITVIGEEHKADVYIDAITRCFRALFDAVGAPDDDEPSAGPRR